MHLPASVVDLLDLVLARACHLCDEPGRVLCPACLASLRGRCLDVTPAGHPFTIAALPYDGQGRDLVLTFKERGTPALAPMLGVLLADAVRHHLKRLGTMGCALVPIPSHPHPERGFDALGSITAHASHGLAAGGLACTVSNVLAPARSYRPLKDLSREERHLAVDGAFEVRRRARHVPIDRPVIVVDDVITTGATTGEAIRALRDAGLTAHGVAAVTAATRGTWARTRAPAPTTSRP